LNPGRRGGNPAINRFSYGAAYDQHLPAKYSVFPLLFGAEHYQSLETALASVGYHYLKMDPFHIEFCNDIAF
jgi:hypothetical protein